MADVITHYPFPPPGEAAPIEREPYPAPSLTSDMSYVGLLSDPAAGLLSLAQAHGWAGRVTCARGRLPHATTGKPGAAEKLSEAVRLARGDQRAVGVRMGGTWASLWTWSRTQFFTRYATLEAFKEALR